MSGHYEERFEKYTCPCCNEENLNYVDVTYINSYAVKREPKLKIYEHEYICQKCFEKIYLNK